MLRQYILEAVNLRKWQGESPLPQWPTAQYPTRAYYKRLIDPICRARKGAWHNLNCVNYFWTCENYIMYILHVSSR